MRALHVILSLAVSGCNYISKADMEAREPGLDNDNDGVIASEDCDDNNADISPENVEIWYDGIDGDCGGDDDYDADKDGYVPTQFAGLQTAEVKATGILPPGDCADEDPSAHPNAQDEFYDGVDSDCAGNDDFDQDGDGFASRDHEYATTLYANGTGSLSNSDCDDTLDDVNPDVEDIPYSGIDEDCAGNDDYDLDNDGFYDDSTPIFYGATIYAEETTGNALPGDCDDSNPAAYLGAEDNFYDGVDHDCAGNDDFDQDYDGYVQDVHVGQPTVYVSGSGILPGGDCNDDPALGGDEAYPSATEVISDDVDHDCDALSAEIGAKTFRLTLAEDLNFIGVHSMKFGENSTGIHLAIGADESETNANGIIRALTFEPLDPIGTDPTSITLNEGSASTSSGYTLAPDMSFWVDPDVHLSLTGGIWATGMRALYLRGYDDIDGEATGAAIGPIDADEGLDEWDQMTSVDLFRDASGDFHAIGCDDTIEVFHYNTATPESLHLGEEALSTYATYRHTNDFSANRCALMERDDGQVVLLSNHEDIFTASTIDPLTEELTLFHDPLVTGLPVPDAALTAADITSIVVPSARAPESVFAVIDDFNNDILVANQDLEVIQTMNLAASPVSLDAVFAPDGTLYVLVVDSAGDGWLSWGALDEELSEPLQLAPPDLEPTPDLTSAAMWIDDTTGNILQVAVTVEEDGSTADPVYLGAAYLDSPS